VLAAHKETVGLGWEEDKLPLMRAGNAGSGWAKAQVNTAA